MTDDTRLGHEVAPQASWLVARFRAVDVAAAEEVRSILDAFRMSVIEEQGAGDYVPLADSNDPASTWVLEKWATPADAERHEAAAGESDGAGRLQGLLAEPFTPVHSRVVARTKANDRSGRR